MINKLKISSAVVIISLVPLLFSAIGFWLWVDKINQSVDDSRASFQVIQLMSKLDNVAKSFAVERGLTAGFLGNQTPEAFNKVKNQRKTADEALKNLAVGEFDQLSKSQITKVIEVVTSAAKNLKAVRSAVDSGTSPQAFVFYTNINEQSLNQYSKLGLSVGDEQLRTELRIAYQLLSVREEAGKIRGKLNGVFAKGQVNTHTFVEVAGFINNEKSALANVLQDGSVDLVSKLQAIQTQAHWNEVKSISAGFINSSDLSAITGPGNWFELATKRIGDIGALAKDISQNVNNSAQMSVSEGERLVNIAFTSLTVIFAIILGITFLFSRSISDRVNDLLHTISEINNKNDLSIRLPVESNDEISQISRQMNEHLDHISSAFSEIQHSVYDNVDNLDLAKNSTSSVSENVNDQNHMTDSIVVAVEEMTQTIDSITTSMRDAAAHTHELVNSCTEGHSKINETTKIMEEVKTQIDSSASKVTALSNDITSVTTLLSDIEQIAEQTNLLALNAAIEAARAGEQGRGFAVVADEVRNLAKRTQVSTEQVKSILLSLEQNSTSAISAMETNTELVNQSNQKVADNSLVIESLFNAINKINEMIEQTATASEQQTVAANEISNNVVNASDLSKEIVEMAQDANQGVSSTLDEFKMIKGKLKEFVV